MESNENDGFNFTSNNDAPPDQPDFSFPEKYDASGEEKISAEPHEIIDRKSLNNDETVKSVAEVVEHNVENNTDHGPKETNNAAGDIGYHPPDLSFVLPKRDSSGSEAANESAVVEPTPEETTPQIPHVPQPDTASPVSEPAVEHVTEETPQLNNTTNTPTVDELDDTVPVTSTEDSEEVTPVEPTVEEMKVEHNQSVKENELEVEQQNDHQEKIEENDEDLEQTSVPENKKESLEPVPEVDMVDKQEEAKAIKDEKETEKDLKEEDSEMKAATNEEEKMEECTKEEPDAMEVEEVPKTPKEVIMSHISTVYQCLDDYMNTKDEVIIKDCMSLLLELKTLADKTLDSAMVKQNNSHDNKGKKGKRGKGKQTKTRDSSSSKRDKNESADESESEDLPGLVNLKDIKGLAVFAKWPHSGWFYPGMVKDLLINDWKNSTNITVSFYDGLERDMKSIHILPAQLIPSNSVLFDLDNETEMTVVSSEKADDWVTFSLNQNKSDEVVQRGFDKLAIKAGHMKAIKQAIDSTTDGASSKANPVTPENMVAGRRMRGKSSIFNEDYVSSSPRSVDKRRGKTEDESKTTSNRTPAKRKAKAEEETPAKSATKSRRQVNGTKSTPRRKASTKGK